jgi:acyl-CoA dehydrogenase
MTQQLEITDLARRVFATATQKHPEEFDSDLWRTLEETGLSLLSTPEPSGGGGTAAEGAAVIIEAGAHAAQVPLVETDLLAGWLAHEAGIEVPGGPLTAARARLDATPDSAGGAVINGTARRVGWGRHASAILLLTPSAVCAVSPAATMVVRGANLASEPRDDIRIRDLRVAAGGFGPARAGLWEEFAQRAAFGRALLITGAARSAIAASASWARTRTQFGRPIGAFQAVQQQLALAAAEVSAAEAAADAALMRVGAHGFGPGAGFAIAMAKARASQSATAVARCAHQVHGAIGMTYEHDLRTLTTRLWAWRDEDGSESYWNERVGAEILALPDSELWPAICSYGGAQ